MGAVLIALSIGVLLVDQYLAPWYPFLLVTVLGLALAASRELLGLLGPGRKLHAWLCYAGVAGLIGMNWLVHVVPALAAASPWPWIAGVLAGFLLTAFLVEMSVFQEPLTLPSTPGGEGRVRGPGESVTRIALTFWLVGYLGLLPSFLAQLRWLPDVDGVQRSTVALALVFFVPKICDSGAYFTGRLFGRHKMTPVLSPKKTWEGAVGGLIAAVGGAIGINQLGPAIPGGLAGAAAFGLVMGVTGMLGDLAESLVKRDCQRKDASQVMPGFGGVLDVVDSIVFSAPVAYWWLS
jgi:phosphatidate cytidylyltransferase